MEPTTENTQVVTTDNSVSDVDLSSQIEQALDEPEITTEPTVEDEPEPTAEPAKTVEDNTIKCPDKFKKFANEDGSLNVDNLLKSYGELEPILNERAQWKEERAELLKAKEQLDAINRIKEEDARRAGFNSVQDMQQEREIAGLEVSEYMKYLGYVDEESRDHIKGLLERYAVAPSAELMREIELEFAPEVNKHVAIQAFQKRQVFDNEKANMAQTAKMTNIESVIDKAVDANGELFNYEPFKKMFVNALYKFGDSFSYDDAKALMDTVSELKGIFRTEIEKELETKTKEQTQNKQATDALAAITNTNSAPVASQNPNLDILSDKELAKYINEYI